MAVPQSSSAGPRSQSMKIIVVVIAILLAISYSSQWYAREISMPRYCVEPERYVERVAEIITNKELLQNDSRRQYLVAAKLNYLAPRHAAESTDSYLQRLQRQLEETCS